ncbi:MULTISPECIES: NAD-dependent epimerase/dehydratase family protein [unclassified Flavobacterium]|uniref:NAD-dependent epimerase/dehydratase family protein n=1 Tax=unclassified Flavobacterium TaxID=196869 RepID=UPI0006AB8147|nr:MULTISPECIES: NAD-dependent epimerase/dehydratase family protein [unclassified Flavobacterium]KOP39494.1 dehydratase [Flavobacterium sp. VMW]OWU91778.1 dehydratase [Flavobacterium sp. NLM]
MKITITGASGFVGINLQQYLKDLYQINTLSIRYISDQKIEISSDAIIHLAGKAHDLKKVSKPSDYYEANFELTKQLFDAFLISKANVFIFMSSVKASSDKVEGILSEDNTCNPKTHYGISKNKAEEYILSKKLPDEKRVYIIRPCMIHGPGNKGNLNLLYNLVSKGIPWPLGSFENQRSFLSVENLCFVIREILDNKSISSGIYNVADDLALSTNELILILNQTLDKRSNILKIPISLISRISRIGDIFKLPLNSERLQKLTENYVVSNNKIIKAIGKPLPVTTNEGLIKTFKSFRKNNKLK